jgi:methionyl-tRNA formyltransferase
LDSKIGNSRKFELAITNFEKPPRNPVDLIIAVSFGLFVPSRLLDAAKYGGINIHPSLLPV